MIQQKQKMLRTADHSLGLLTLRMIPKITSDGRLSPVPSPEKPHVCSTETEPTGGSRPRCGRTASPPRSLKADYDLKRSSFGLGNIGQ